MVDSVKWNSHGSVVRANGRAHARAKMVLTPVSGGGLLLPPGFPITGVNGDRTNGTTLLKSSHAHTRSAHRDGPFHTSAVFSLRADMEGNDSIKQPYREAPWIRAGIKAISTGFASLPFELWDGDPSEEGSTQFDDTHPLITLLKRPNPTQTAREFWFAHAVNRKLDGESLWFLADENAQPILSDGDRLLEMPAQIIMARGAQVEDTRNKNGVIERWRFSLGGGKRSKEWQANSVIHFSEYDPYDPVRGMGDVDALVSSINSYFQMDRYVTTVLNNGGDPGAWIVYDEMISAHELDRRQAEVDEEYAVQNAGRYKVLGRNAKITPNPMRPKDMEYLDGQRFQRDVQLALLGVQPPVVGIQDNATYNNIAVATREMWAGPNGIVPSVVDPTTDGIENKFLWRLRDVLDNDAQTNATARFNTSKVEALRESQEDKVTLATELASKGVGVTFNEALTVVGADVESPDGGDTPLLHSTFRDPAQSGDGTRTLGDRMDCLFAEVERLRSGRGVQTQAKREVPQSHAGQSDGTAARRAVARIPRPNKRLTSSLLSWLREYEIEQIKHLERFAEDSKAAPGKPSKRSLELWTAAVEAVRAQSIDDLTHTPDHAEFNEHLDRTIDFGTRLDEFRANLSKKDLERLLLNEDAWTDALAADVEDGIRGATRDALGAVRDKMPHGPFLSITDPKVVDQMLEQRLFLAQSVGATTRERVRRRLIIGLLGADEKLSLQAAVKQELPKLTKDLKRVFGTKSQRASAIAQTETQRAFNTTAFAQFEESGATHTEWLTANDDLVRETHAENGRQGEVELGEPFSNGMTHPHEPGAPAEEVINCRCELVATQFKELEDE